MVLKRTLTWGMLCLALIMSGCTRQSAVLSIKKDGSGTLTLSMYMSEISQKMTDGELTTDEELAELEQGFRETKGIGEGVTLVSFEKERDKKSGIQMVTTYAFPNIEKISNYSMPGSSRSGGQMPSKPGGTNIHTRFQFEQGDPAKLIVNLREARPVSSSRGEEDGVDVERGAEL